MFSSQASQTSPAWHGTTILAVRRGQEVVLAADGQVTLGAQIIKHSAHKLRTLAQGQILVGFAGATADAFTLFERLEAELTAHNGHLVRAAVELTKQWRTDRMLRRLEAMVLAADAKHTLLLSGNGDVLEPDTDAAGIGSGGTIAQAAANALLEHTTLPPRQIAEIAMQSAAKVCVYTNNSFCFEQLRATT